MPNWYSLPTFGAMLLFWLLGAYVLTRSPRSAVSLTAVAAQFATAIYLLGQGMQANAPTLQDWLPWARNTAWAAHVAHVLWYWLTLLILREQESTSAQRYVRRVGYPLGAIFTAAEAGLTASVYVDDLLHVWSRVVTLRAGQAGYSLFDLPEGPLYVWFLAMMAATTIAALANVWMGWRATLDAERRQRFAWLLASAVTFTVGANSLGLANWLSGGAIQPWVGHLLLGAALAMMAWNVAAYSLLFKGQVITTDFFYFLTALTLICALYGAALFLTGPAYSFQLLGLGAFTLTLAILSHAFVDIGRRILDRLFFGSEVQRLRSNLASVVQSAGLTQNLDSLLNEAEIELAEVSAERMASWTEEALRRLNNPATMAECALMERIPLTIAAACGESDGNAAGSTPLERARALREVLVSAIERLKPADDDVRIFAPAALQYNILREEYLLGLLNKQIMIRHSISEGTFHRNRRQAIWSLARELQEREALMSRQEVGVS